MKRIVLIVSVLALIVNLSCNNDENTLDNEALLKTKKWFYYVEDTMPIVTYKYEYDSYNRLIKINSYEEDTDQLFAFETLHYNSEGNVEFKLHYSDANDSSGWALIDSTYFQYENGLLKSKQILYQSPSPYTVSYYYEYENSLVVKNCRYDNQVFSSCIQYDYSNNFCTKETTFLDAELTSVYSYTTHYYNNDLLIESDKYSYRDYIYQIIKYEYDLNENLILEFSEETDFKVSMHIEYAYQYEYF